jgi:hypothetical protein
VAKKKKGASRKPAAKKARAKSPKTAADTSRLDTGPLQEHIKKRIKELEGQAAKGARQDDGTLERLKMALETIEDICFPTMTVPI